MGYLTDARKALWHFRHGGMSQVREWRRRERLGLNATTSTKGFRPLDVAPVSSSHRGLSFPSIRLGVIMDDFSLAAWGGEFAVTPVTPSSWATEIDAIDLLFVESAWNGNGGAWQYKLTGAAAPAPQLQDLVAACQKRGIPTVFWNKEDPPHFDDFLDTAKLFDVVFTSDSNMIPAYIEALGHDRVQALPFAAAPAIHNPIRERGTEPAGDLAFAGMYFAHKYPERREQMNLILGAAVDASRWMDNGLSIYARFQDKDENYRYPAEFAAHVVGELPYASMVSAYQKYKVFLNVNSVVDSPSMCARRVFEITASGTPVISTRSAAIPRFFPDDEVPIVDDRQRASWMMRALVSSTMTRERMVHKAQRRIWESHTYEHRAHQVLDAAGIEHVWNPTPSATIMVSTNRPHQLDHVIAQAGQQVGIDLQLAILSHGFKMDEADILAKARDAGITDTVLLHGDPSLELGDCLNRLIDVAEGQYAAKFDDDDLYRPHYLRDAINAQRFSGADLVGKQAVFLYLGSTDTVILRSPEREHRWSTFVAGPTFVGPTDTFRATRFASRTHGEDTTFLRHLLDAGGSVYSADRFNFMQIRGRSGDHTWTPDDLEILANSRAETIGLSLDHITV